MDLQKTRHITTDNQHIRVSIENQSHIILTAAAETRTVVAKDVIVTPLVLPCSRSTSTSKSAVSVSSDRDRESRSSRLLAAKRMRTLPERVTFSGLAESKYEASSSNCATQPL